MKLSQNKRCENVLFYLTIFLLLASNVFPIVESTKMIDKGGRILYVDGSNIEGPWDGTKEHPYPHIQDAVNNTGDGDTVYVFNGVYDECVVINKSITLVGQNRTKTIVDALNLGTVIYVIKDRVTISNLTIRNSGGYKGDSGVKLDANHSIIANCTIYRTRTGVCINNTRCNMIRDCSFHTNGEGILVQTSSGDTVDNCCFSHNALGLNLQKAEDIRLCDFYADNNGIGLYMENSSNINIYHSAFYNNNDNQGGVFIDKSKHVIVWDCNIYHNGFGIRVLESSSVWINRCNGTWNTHIAIMVGKQSKEVIISGCNISYNFRYGVYIDENSCASIHYNNIYKNTLYGVFCENSYSDTQNNWWGSFIGPSFTEVGPGDRVTKRIRFIRYMPWRTKPVEDIGSTWKLNVSNSIHNVMERFQPVEIEGTDSDDDTVPDWWEAKYGYDPFKWDDHLHLDPDNDGLNNIEECYTYRYDSNPFHKDLFVEFDWVARYPGDITNKPSIEYIETMKSVFEKHNISLHIDEGSLGGGEEIPYVSNFSYAGLRDLYWDYFLHNDLNNPRKGIFHYCIVCFYGPGPGFAFVGWDDLDSFDISAQMLQNRYRFLERQRLIIGGSIHELGHTLGLFVDDHGGIDNMGDTKILSLEWWKYKNYRSCMNYLYTYIVIDYSDGSHGWGDFDDWSNLDFCFFKNSSFEWPK